MYKMLTIEDKIKILNKIGTTSYTVSSEEYGVRLKLKPSFFECIATCSPTQLYN